MGQQSKKPYVILGLSIITAFIVVFYANLSYHYEMQGKVSRWTDYDIEIIQYSVSAASDGTGQQFAVTGGDPQFILTRMSENDSTALVSGIELQFGKAWEEKEPLSVQVFYARAGENFTEKHSVKSVLMAGEQVLQIPIPQGQYWAFRFDIDGDFTLAGIQSCDAPMSAQAYVSREATIRYMWYFPAIALGFCLIYWAHRVRMRQGGFSAKSYGKYILLGAAPEADREVYLDYLRVLAAVLVILAHTCSSMVDQADAGWKRLVLVCGLSLGLCCNLLYVMLSGTLLLSSSARKTENVIAFYIRRASKVIIPLIAYYLLLLYLGGEVHFLPPENFGSAFVQIVAGAPDIAPHLWLIYTIVALYIAAPFFQVMVQHMSDRLLFSMAAVIIVLNMLTTYLPLFGMSFGAASFLSGWEGVFLLGYIMTRQNGLAGAGRRNRILMLAAVVSYGIMVAAVFADSDLMQYVYGSTPTIVVTSCGIFALFVNYKDIFQGKSNALVRLFAKYSYSIILIHWYVLFVVVQGRLHITPLRFGCIGGVGASVAVTLVVCTVMAVVFDNTVVIVCNVLFDKLTTGLAGGREQQKNGGHGA